MAQIPATSATSTPVSAISAISATTAPASSPAPSSSRRRVRALGVVSALASLAALAPFATAVAHASPATPLAPPPVRDEDRPDYGRGDQLLVTVRDSGVPGADGVYRLSCHPGGGTHPHADAACAALDRNSVWGRDAFAPVPDGSVCTLQYGGPATAHVTGRWAGRPVDATFERSNGCEIERWDRFVPLLPEVHAGRPSSPPSRHPIHHPSDHTSGPSRPSGPSHPFQPADPSRPAPRPAPGPSTRPAPRPSLLPAPLPAPLPEPAPEPRPAR
jgi:hypothetical protein